MLIFSSSTSISKILKSIVPKLHVCVCDIHMERDYVNVGANSTLIIIHEFMTHKLTAENKRPGSRSVISANVTLDAE